MSVVIGYTRLVLGGFATWPRRRFLYPFVQGVFVQIKGKRRGHHRRIFKMTFHNSCGTFGGKQFSHRKSGAWTAFRENMLHDRHFGAFENNHTFMTAFSSAKVDTLFAGIVGQPFGSHEVYNTGYIPLASRVKTSA